MLTCCIVLLQHLLNSQYLLILVIRIEIMELYELSFEHGDSYKNLLSLKLIFLIFSPKFRTVFIIHVITYIICYC